MPDSQKQTLELIRQAKSGDKTGLNEVCRRYLSRVHEIAHLRLGQLRGRTDSMDIVQSALYEAVRDLDQFDADSDARLINWLAKIVENKIRDKVEYYGTLKRDINREVRQEPIDDRPISQLGMIDPSDITSPAAMMMVAELERMKVVEEAMEHLSDGDREIIICRNHCGMTFPEIAQELSIKQDAARMRYVRAVSRLTELLRDKVEL